MVVLNVIIVLVILQAAVVLPFLPEAFRGQQPEPTHSERAMGAVAGSLSPARST